MDIKKLMSELEDLSTNPKIDMIGIEELQDYFLKAAETIKELYAKAHGLNKWVSCRERLPELSGEYLTTVMYDGKLYVDINEIECGLLKKWDHIDSADVKAWQYLPEIYNPENE